MFSSKSDEWETPQELFDELNKEFHFTLDPCANEQNHKCEKYYTKEMNGLSQCWKGENVFCNPPYGREIGSWVRRCYLHGRVSGCVSVMLIPARTDTKWFHDYIYNKENVEIRFLKGRLKFGNAKNSAPFPSMIVVFREKEAIPISRPEEKWKPKKVLFEDIGYDQYHDVNVYACICPDCGLHIIEFTDDDVDQKCNSDNPEDMFKSSMVHHGYIGLGNFCERCGRKLDWGDYPRDRKEIQWLKSKR